MTAYYGADTGLYHLAAAMDIPATVVFGPTQPGRIILPRQNAASVRLEVLAEEHCDVKACRNPVCIEQACANLAPQPVVIPLDADTRGLPAAPACAGRVAGEPAGIAIPATRRRCEPRSTVLDQASGGSRAASATDVRA